MTKEEEHESEVVAEKPEDLPLPPSVRAGESLIDSYTYHSVDQGPNEKDVNTEYILGVDEAGRGPVIGPQVYAAAYCPASFEDELRDLGFADSKTLTHEKRGNLLDVIMDNAQNNLCWAVRVMSPRDISKDMLRRNPYNLNAQSHDATINLIRDIVNKGYRISKVFVDTVGPPATYQSKLESEFPGISFTVASKADSLYPIVSAASIAAKVTRDTILENWVFQEHSRFKTGDHEQLEAEWSNFGSGYPSDPATQSWLNQTMDPVFGLPNIARFSWNTVKNLLEKKAYKTTWIDEPKSIQRYMENGDDNNNVKRSKLHNEWSLESVNSV